MQKLTMKEMMDKFDQVVDYSMFDAKFTKEVNSET